jgi:hypothetical protein
MTESNFATNRFFLNFKDNTIERLYKEHILAQLLLFSKIAWIIIIVFEILFAFFDDRFFGDRASAALVARVIVTFISVLMILGMLSKRAIHLIDWNATFFITTLGLFSVFLTTLAPTTIFSPYALGIVMAFTGVVVTVGIGFRFTLFTILMITLIFEITIGVVSPVSQDVFILYTLFIPTFAIIFGYIAYFIEKISRKNFIITSQLRKSIENVNQLSGFLPICSSCKKIRDDAGYWSQVEEYISVHSEANFSHSYCPECAETVISEIENTVVNDSTTTY